MLTDRFWSKVSKDADGCWRWTAALDTKGYGVVRIDRVQRQAHRVAYIELVGEIPQGLQLDHLCRVRNCVNPAHLDAVTAAENIRRGLTGEHQRAKTCCPQGHPYSGTDAAGGRICKTCRNEAGRRRRAHKKGATA